jgi:hypothetical protein
MTLRLLFFNFYCTLIKKLKIRKLVCAENRYQANNSKKIKYFDDVFSLLKQKNTLK